MSQTSSKYLIFQLAGKRFAFDLAQVAEVCELPETWPIPMAPRCYQGAMNFHGTIVAVMDLTLFLGLDITHPPEKTIVLDTRIAALACRVDHVIRIESVNPSEVHAGSHEPLARGYLSLADGNAVLLDAAAIAQRAGETIND
jgi:chemotaxis signal transduction protein